MADVGGVVPGSEGKIGARGEYKVEIEPVDDNTLYKICLRFATGLGADGNNEFVDNVDVPEFESELKAEGNLIDDVDAITDPDDIYRPAFRVYTGGTADTSCDGLLEFESGLTVDKP